MYLTEWLRTAARCGTGLAVTLLIGGVAEARELWLAQPVHELKYAALTTEKSQDSAETTGSYTVDDSAALQKMIDATEPSKADGVEPSPSALQHSATLEVAPYALTKYTQSPEAKAYQAWEFQSSKVVPEPSTMMLMGLGLAAFAAFRNKGIRSSR